MQNGNLGPKVSHTAKKKAKKQKAISAAIDQTIQPLQKLNLRVLNWLDTESKLDKGSKAEQKKISLRDLIRDKNTEHKEANLLKLKEGDLLLCLAEEGIQPGDDQLVKKSVLLISEKSPSEEQAMDLVMRCAFKQYSEEDVLKDSIAKISQCTTDLKAVLNKLKAIEKSNDDRRKALFDELEQLKQNCESKKIRIQELKAELTKLQKGLVKWNSQLDNVEPERIPFQGEQKQDFITKLSVTAGQMTTEYQQEWHAIGNRITHSVKELYEILDQVKFIDTVNTFESIDEFDFSLTLTLDQSLSQSCSFHLVSSNTIQECLARKQNNPLTQGPLAGNVFVVSSPITILNKHRQTLIQAVQPENLGSQLKTVMQAAIKIFTKELVLLQKRLITVHQESQELEREQLRLELQIDLNAKKLHTLIHRFQASFSTSIAVPAVDREIESEIEKLFRYLSGKKKINDGESKILTSDFLKASRICDWKRIPYFEFELRTRGVFTESQISSIRAKYNYHADDVLQLVSMGKLDSQRALRLKPEDAAKLHFAVDLICKNKFTVDQVLKLDKVQAEWFFTYPQSKVLESGLISLEAALKLGEENFCRYAYTFSLVQKGFLSEGEIQLLTFEETQKLDYLKNYIADTKQAMDFIKRYTLDQAKLLWRLEKLILAVPPRLTIERALAIPELNYIQIFILEGIGPYKPEQAIIDQILKINESDQKQSLQNIFTARILIKFGYPIDFIDKLDKETILKLSSARYLLERLPVEDAKFLIGVIMKPEFEFLATEGLVQLSDLIEHGWMTVKEVLSFKLSHQEAICLKFVLRRHFAQVASLQESKQDEKLSSLPTNRS